MNLTPKQIRDAKFIQDVACDRGISLDISEAYKHLKKIRKNCRNVGINTSISGQAFYDECKEYFNN